MVTTIARLSHRPGGERASSGDPLRVDAPESSRVPDSAVLLRKTDGRFVGRVRWVVRIPAPCCQASIRSVSFMRDSGRLRDTGAVTQ